MRKKLRKFIFDYLPVVAKTGLVSAIPSLYPYLEIKPTSSNIMLTNRCNLRCIMCRQWRESPSDELSTEDWKGVIRDLKKNGIKNIHFTGGEPFLRKDLIELVRYCRDNGFVLGLTTNGILLKKDILEDIVDAGLRSMAISVDSLGPGYEKIRGLPDSFDKIKNTLSTVAAMRMTKNLDVYINFTLMNENINKFEEVKKFAEGYGFPVAICLLDKSSSIFDVEENKAKFWISKEKDLRDLDRLVGYLRREKSKNPGTLLLNYPMIDFIAEYFKDPRQVHIPCVSSQDRIAIDPYGNLLGGCLSMGKFGNLKDEPLEDLFRRQRYMEARRNMYYKKCAGCSCGYQFNIKTFPPMLIRDIAARIKYKLFSGS